MSLFALLLSARGLAMLALLSGTCWVASHTVHHAADDVFQTLHSASEEVLGKPHPAVYLSTASSLNSDTGDILALEDSYAGLMAAKSAGMKTIVIPWAGQYEDPRFDLADLKLRSLENLHKEHILSI